MDDRTTRGQVMQAVLHSAEGLQPNGLARYLANLKYNAQTAYGGEKGNVGYALQGLAKSNPEIFTALIGLILGAIFGKGKGALLGGLLGGGAGALYKNWGGVTKGLGEWGARAAKPATDQAVSALTAAADAQQEKFKTNVSGMVTDATKRVGAAIDPRLAQAKSMMDQAADMQKQGLNVNMQHSVDVYGFRKGDAEAAGSQLLKLAPWAFGTTRSKLNQYQPPAQSAPQQ